MNDFDDFVLKQKNFTNKISPCVIFILFLHKKMK
jgi:hypothetical protein